ncbi:Stp1/IreP family PP2C-type Ser/Thr phosphatase [bacterium]|nr:Stp1/IreP family PP2C-type Ser/Thr phosphatase [bacterium]
MIHYQVYAQSDIGKKRSQNEDALLVDDQLGLFVVADGMGGHAAGEVASANAVNEIKKVVGDNRALIQAFQDGPSAQRRWAVKELIEKAVQSANNRIYRLALMDPAQKKMGTTVTCLLLLENHGIIGHVGDTRLYLVRDGRIHQLTEDHSLVSQHLKQGRISKEEAKSSPYQNVLTRAVGVQEWVEIDLIDFELEQNDRFLLASDGLHGYFEEEELLELFNKEPLEHMLSTLIDLSNERGGKDNITGILVNVEQIKLEHKITSATRKINSLKAVPLFQKLSYRQLTQIANILKETRYPSDSHIITEGDPGDTFYICLEGRVKVQKGVTTMTELKAGDYFGEMALVDNTPRSANVIALTDCHILSMSRHDFFDLIKQNPHIAIKFLWNFTQVLTQRLRQTSMELSVAFGEPVELPDLMSLDQGGDAADQS